MANKRMTDQEKVEFLLEVARRMAMCISSARYTDDGLDGAVKSLEEGYGEWEKVLSSGEFFTGHLMA